MRNIILKISINFEIAKQKSVITVSLILKPRTYSEFIVKKYNIANSCINKVTAYRISY